MHKAERLFQLTNLLRGRRTTITAKTLADKLGVSERTIYRDIQALELSGVPIEGEAGVGYRIRYDFDLPPLMFDRSEIIALALGSRMVQSWSDKGLAEAAGRALDKINAILPDDLKALSDQQTFLVPNFLADSHHAETSLILRKAVESHHQLLLRYRREDGECSERILDPMGMIYWGGKWTLVAWCHLRSSYRQFRIDRMMSVERLASVYQPTPTHCFEHYMALANQDYQDSLTGQGNTGKSDCSM